MAITAEQGMQILNALARIPGMPESQEIADPNVDLVGGEPHPTFRPYDPLENQRVVGSRVNLDDMYELDTSVVGLQRLDVDRRHRVVSTDTPIVGNHFTAAKLTPDPAGPKNNGNHILTIFDANTHGDVSVPVAPTVLSRTLKLSNSGMVQSPLMIHLTSSIPERVLAAMGIDTSTAGPLALPAQFLKMLSENYAYGNRAYSDGTYPLGYELLTSGGQTLALGGDLRAAIDQLQYHANALEAGAFTLVVRSTQDQREIAMIKMEELVPTAPSYPQYEGRTGGPSLTIQLSNFTRPHRGESRTGRPARPVGFKGDMVQKLLQAFAPKAIP